MTQLFPYRLHPDFHQLFTQHDAPRIRASSALEPQDKGTRFVLSSFSAVRWNHKKSVLVSRAWIGPFLVHIAILSLAVLGILNIPCRHRVLVGVAEIEGEQIDLALRDESLLTLQPKVERVSEQNR